MLSNRYRFHGPNSLRFVYKNGQTAHSRTFKVKAVYNPRRSEPRFSVVVSKKVHKSAVGRNRIRRRFYEIIREQIPMVQPNIDVVVIITSGESLFLVQQDMKSAIKQLFQELNLYK